MNAHIVASKSCSTCKEVKTEDKFYKRGKSLRSACKTCTAKSNTAWKAANSTKLKERNTAYYAANREMFAAKSKVYYLANTEKIAAKCASYQAANKKEIVEKNAARYAANPEKFAARGVAWRNNNPEKEKARGVVWRFNNPDKIRINNHARRALKCAAGGKLSPGLAAKLYKLQRGKCPCCNKPLGDDYHLDHIMPLFLGGSNTDDNIQLLRQRCNNQKHARHPIDFMQSRGFLL